jgi:hypothetical protein
VIANPTQEGKINHTTALEVITGGGDTIIIQAQPQLPRTPKKFVKLSRNTKLL